MTIKLAEMPVYCAGCHNQQPNLRHVDFDSALDRGYGKVEAIQVSYDDAVFCENCVRVAGEQIGMIDGTAWKTEKAELERKLDLSKRELAQARKYADTMESAIENRPKPIKIDPRSRPRHIREQEPV